MTVAPKPFFKSSLYSSTDPSAIPDALMRGFNVVVLVDVEESGQYPACYPLSSLLPPYNLVHLILNTDRSAADYDTVVNTYLNTYYAYLATPDKEDQIVNLLASMYKTTKNALIFAEEDVEKQFSPLYVLTQFFVSQFGINILPYTTIFENVQYPIFNAAPPFIYRIIELLFTNAYITKEEYALMLPIDSIPSPRAVQILLSDYNHVFPTMEAALTAACNILDSIRQQANTGMICPVVRLSEKLDEVRSQQVQQLINNSNTHFGPHSMAQIQQKGPIVGRIDGPR